MKFPEQYIRKGRFELHSGETSDIFYDVNALITDCRYMELILNEIPKSKHYVGIVTGGALIALGAARLYGSEFSMIKDGELKGRSPGDDWVLVDDVATTESSIREALRILKTSPREIFVAIDRREIENRKLKLGSVFEV